MGRMRLKSEDEILNLDVRIKLAEEIDAPEERARKSKSYRQYKVLKDQTDIFVKSVLLKQFSPDTVNEMEYSISNISLMRKIVNKLARVYQQGVQRSIVSEEGKENEEETKKLNDLEVELDINTQLKTVNRYLKAAKNTALWLKSCQYFDEMGNPKYKVRPTPLFSHLYSVVEQYYDRTKPLGMVLSNYDESSFLYTTMDAASIGRGFSASQTKTIGDNRDQLLADKKEDEGKTHLLAKRYTWWGDKYHFTFDGVGNFIDPQTDSPFKGEVPVEFIENPIGINPILDFNIDQDNSYWSEGGDDLVHGAVVINSLITQANHIAVTQGYGQFYAIGDDIPTNIMTGPNRTIVLTAEEDKPRPEIGFVNANPPLAELWSIIESQAALLLTTNNLSTSGVKTQLDGGNSSASGIALIIDKAESMEDVDDQRQLFVDKEPIMWDIINRWLEFHGAEGDLDESLKGLQLQDNFDLMLEFNDQKAIQSESEKLDNLQKRKDLGLNEMFEIIKMDQPSLSDEQAKEKLKRIEEEKKSRMDAMAVNGGNPESDDEEDDLDAEGDEDKPNPFEDK